MLLAAIITIAIGCALFGVIVLRSMAEPFVGKKRTAGTDRVVTCLGIVLGSCVWAIPYSISPSKFQIAEKTQPALSPILIGCIVLSYAVLGVAILGYITKPFIESKTGRQIVSIVGVLLGTCIALTFCFSRSFEPENIIGYNKEDSSFEAKYKHPPSSLLKQRGLAKFIDKHKEAEDINWSAVVRALIFMPLMFAGCITWLLTYIEKTRW